MKHKFLLVACCNGNFLLVICCNTKILVVVTGWSAAIENFCLWSTTAQISKVASFHRNFLLVVSCTTKFLLVVSIAVQTFYWLSTAVQLPSIKRGFSVTTGNFTKFKNLVIEPVLTGAITKFL